VTADVYGGAAGSIFLFLDDSVNALDNVATRGCKPKAAEIDPRRRNRFEDQRASTWVFGINGPENRVKK
jgi:hypothetical protein